MTILKTSNSDRLQRRRNLSISYNRSRRKQTVHLSASYDTGSESLFFNHRTEVYSIKMTTADRSGQRKQGLVEPPSLHALSHDSESSSSVVFWKKVDYYGFPSLAVLFTLLSRMSCVLSIQWYHLSMLILAFPMFFLPHTKPSSNITCDFRNGTKIILQPWWWRHKIFSNLTAF